ncbi:MAG TPA: aspartate aminotransferase family protein [Chloroflexi bacterium]|nr:aspartate aminotransferase family protein [Chloroflexota bacterium]
MNEGYYKSLYSQAIAKAAPRLCLDQSEKWFARSNKTIPGSSQTFSKGYTQYVQGVSPVFLKSGAGCLVWDVDGNEYIDYVQGLLPNILGYANHEVNLAVTQQIAEGHSFSLPHPLEIELAEQLVDLVPCAEMVRFGKNGSDATSGAVRAARAFTGRDRIACCGYHGWQDWYVGTTTRNIGVPEVVQSLTHKFDYNDLDSLSTLLEKHPGEFAAVIMEPVNFVEPDPGYLEGVKELTQLHGTLLIFDEICSGFHFGLGGAQKFYGVIPDLACFGKAMGNGFPISCILGKTEVMTMFEEIFFSFTMGGEIASIAAALKVIDILKTTDALETIKSNGKKLQDGLNVMSSEAGLQDCIKCVGHPSWSLIRFSDIADCESAVIRTLFIQELNKRGILSLGAHNMSTSHNHAHIEQTLHTYADVLKTISGWLNETQPESFLEGPIIRPVFQAR